MEPELRADRPRDRDGIAAIAAEIVADGTVFPFEDVAGVLRYWYAPRARRVVAVVNGRIAGTYALKPNQPDRGAHVANAGYMVAEAHRGRGLGRRLGEHSIRTARALGYHGLQFNQVVATNEAAIRLWKGLGLRVVGEVPASFRHPARGLVGALVMYREL